MHESTESQKTRHPKIINISSFKLSRHHLSLLRKGPKFTPTTKGNYLTAQSDIKNFTRRINIREHFWQQENIDESILRNKSNRQIYSSNQDLQNITQTIENMQPTITEVNDNLTKFERTALEELKNNKELIFKKADKGGSLIVMDRDFYRNKLVIEGHLTSQSYKKVDENCDKKVFSIIKNHVEKFKNILTNNEIDYLTKYEWESSHFYVLPKIHKCQTIINKLNDCENDYIETSSPNDLKSRPIVAGCNSPTQRLSALLEKLLTPISQIVTTYIKDDWHFIRQIPDTLNYKEISLYSVDITSLYTSITHELGIEAIDFWIKKMNHLIPARFTVNFIIESLKIVLQNNNFIFDNQYYNQTDGTAMGTKTAPPYACLVVAYLEETKLFPKVLPKFFTKTECQWIEKHFKRYMDDGFVPLLNSIKIDVFLQCLNSLHPSIRFTEEKGHFTTVNNTKVQTLNFLDVNIILNEHNEIETDIYYKSTNSHDYLNYNSSHPQHTKRNIPFNLAKRIICFVSNTDKMHSRLNELRYFLKNNDYPDEIIEKDIFNASLQGPAPLKNKNQIQLVTTNYSNFNVENIIKTTNNLLKTTKNDQLKEIFRDCDVISSKRQPRNLLKLLSTAKFNDTVIPLTSELSKIKKCTDPRCKICKLYLQTVDEFEMANGKIWKVKCNMNCNSKHIIYFLKCTGCEGKVSYIGKTNNLRLRTNQHISTCKTGVGTDKFDQHVHQCKPNLKEPYFKLFLMMKLKDNNKLLTYESHFHTLGYDTMNSLSS